MRPGLAFCLCGAYGYPPVSGLVMGSRHSPPPRLHRRRGRPSLHVSRVMESAALQRRPCTRKRRTTPRRYASTAAISGVTIGTGSFSTGAYRARPRVRYFLGPARVALGPGGRRRARRVLPPHKFRHQRHRPPLGKRPYPGISTNNQWLAFLTWGEGLHSNHHAAPTSARFALKPHEVDMGWWVITAFRKLRWLEVRHDEVHLTALAQSAPGADAEEREPELV